MSILANIQHAYTPPDLAVINRQIDEVLLGEPLDEILLQKIITQRANLVESLLNTLNGQQKECFATHELKSNDVIITIVEQYRNATKTDLAKVNKASKAIKKYHQV